MKWVRWLSSTIVLSSLAAVSMAGPATKSVNNELIIGKKLDQKSVQEYWTADRLKNAKELTMPIADINAIQKIMT